MKLKPEELTERNYILRDTMLHSELIPFVKKYINKRTWYSAIYYLSIGIPFCLVLICCMKLYRDENIPVTKLLSRVSFGIIISFALIPVHELIHALAYKLQGARQTSFDANLKKFYFLAIADKFVASKREFQTVALAPFIIITIGLLITSLFFGELSKVMILSTLMTHSAFCSGDFALLSYFEFNKKKEIVTYDDKENKVSFFYEKQQ